MLRVKGSTAADETSKPVYSTIMCQSASVQTAGLKLQETKQDLKHESLEGTQVQMSMQKTSRTALINVPFTSPPSLPSLGHSPRSKLVSLDKVFYHTELTTQLICGLVG